MPTGFHIIMNSLEKYETRKKFLMISTLKALRIMKSHKVQEFIVLGYFSEWTEIFIVCSIAQTINKTIRSFCSNSKNEYYSKMQINVVKSIFTFQSKYTLIYLYNKNISKSIYFANYVNKLKYSETRELTKSFFKNYSKR